MGGNGLILLIIVIRLFKLKHPINKSHKTDDKEYPVDGIGDPPVFHKPEKVIGPEKSIYK